MHTINRLAATGLLVIGYALFAGGDAASAQGVQPMPTADVQDEFIQWPLPPGAAAYADIDGRRMHLYVVEQAEIARRSRDAVHSKFWGRIIGTSADAERATWLEGKFRAIGLSDVRIQEFDLNPQWFPGDYEVTVRSGDESLELESAQPFYRTDGTPAAGLDLEAAYVGLGRDANYSDGMVIFTRAKAGLMYEATVGGQKFKEEPQNQGRLYDH